MVDPDSARLASELAAHGTDASPLEAVLDPLPEDRERPPRLTVYPEPDAPPPLARLEGELGAEVEPFGAEAGLADAFGAAPNDTLYEALGVSPQASKEQIEKAYRFCLDMYKEGALATYSLIEAGDAEAVRRRISVAHETLCDPRRRREYDLGLGLVPTEPTDHRFLAGESERTAPSPSSTTAPLPEGPLSGAELRRIRESRGVALREIAVSSKIGLRFLEYIEEDRFALLPPAVYLRGFLLEYARALGLEPRRAADSYMSRLGSRG